MVVPCLSPLPAFHVNFYTDVCDGEIANIAAVVIIHLTTDRYDYNRHIWDIPPANLREGSMLQVPMAITLAMAITLVRLALSLFIDVSYSGATNGLIFAALIVSWFWSCCLRSPLPS